MVHEVMVYIEGEDWRASVKGADGIMHFGLGNTPALALVRLGQHWYEKDFQTPPPSELKELLGSVVTELET